MKKMTPTRTPAACGLKRLAIVPAAGADCRATILIQTICSGAGCMLTKPTLKKEVL